jgi:hypothetical protein
MLAIHMNHQLLRGWGIPPETGILPGFWTGYVLHLIFIPLDNVI